MTLPFDQHAFFEVFRRYNEAVWPLQIVFYGLAAVAVALVLARRAASGRVIAAILALLWAWMGIVYHLVYFSGINPAATLFGALFLAGAAAFAWAGVARRRLAFAPVRGARGAAGYALIAYALVVYPLAGAWLGHAYPAAPTFGLPCPTAIFTLGMLAFLRSPYPAYVLAVPVLWTLIGSQAAWLLGVYQDLGLALAGVVGIWLALRSRAPEARPA